MSTDPSVRSLYFSQIFVKSINTQYIAPSYPVRSIILLSHQFVYGDDVEDEIDSGDGTGATLEGVVGEEIRPQQSLVGNIERQSHVT